MYQSELEARKDIVLYSHKLQAHGLVGGTDGNLSVRLWEDRVLITPSGLRKEDMTLDAPIVIDMEGNSIGTDRRPSTEHKIHLESYRQRSDLRSVIHAHPPKAIAFTLAEQPLDTCLLPEFLLNLGKVPIANYATPSTDDLPRSMSHLILESDTIMLARHGSLTAGKNLSDAFKRLESLEHSAEILIYTRILGGAKPFSADEINKLHGLREFYGINSKTVACTTPPSEQEQTKREESLSPITRRTRK